MLFVPIQTAPSFHSCRLSSLFLLLLFFPPPLFPSFPLTHLRPWFSLTWYTSSASQSLVQGPRTWCNKIKTVHLPAGHSFKASAQWGLSGRLRSSLLPAHLSERLPPGTAAQAQAASLVCLYLFFIIMNLLIIRYVLHLLRSLKALREATHAAYGTLDNNSAPEELARRSSCARAGHSWQSAARHL